MNNLTLIKSRIYSFVWCLPMKSNALKTWIDVNEINPIQLKSTQPSNKVVAYHKSNNLMQQANIELLNDMIKSGFNPKWFGVIHFNDGGNSSKQQQRRLDIDEVTNDLKVVKNFIYTEAYGKKWRRNKRVAKGIWGIEYGNSTLKPHLNIVLEELPYPYNDYKSLFVLLDRFLPDKVRCLWRRSAHLQPVRFNEGINSYITKESDYRNSTIIHDLTDYFIK